MARQPIIPQFGGYIDPATVMGIIESNFIDIYNNGSPFLPKFMLQNFSPAYLYKFQTALGRQASGGANVRIVFAGDSIMAGALSDTVAANYRIKGFPNLIASMLTTAGYPATASSAFGQAASVVGVGQSLGIWDGRISGSGGYATLAAPFYNSFGAYSFTSGTAGSLNFAPINAASTTAVTATSATPCVFTGMTLPNGTPVVLGGTAVPTGFTAFIPYYVVATSSNTFQLSATVGGAAIASSSTGTAVTASTLQTTDTCDIYYYDNLAGTFGTSVDAGSNITTVTVGTTLLVKKQNITYPAAPHVINVNWASGANAIVGFNAWQSTVPQIQLINGAAGGAASTSWNNDGAQILALGMLELLAPDLSCLMIGTNDWIQSTNVSVPTYAAALNTFIVGARLSGDVIFLTPSPAGAASSPLSIQAQYVAAMKAVALANNVPVIDINANLVSKVQMTANGMGSDVNHPNNIGHQVMARNITRGLMTAM